MPSTLDRVQVLSQDLARRVLDERIREDIVPRPLVAVKRAKVRSGIKLAYKSESLTGRLES